MTKVFVIVKRENRVSEAVTVRSRRRRTSVSSCQGELQARDRSGREAKDERVAAHLGSRGMRFERVWVLKAVMCVDVARGQRCRFAGAWTRSSEHDLCLARFGRMWIY